MQLQAVHHIAIICSDYEASKAFYTDLLGFTIIREVYREDRDSYKLDLALNGAYIIELFSFPDAPERPSYPEARGLRHLAFEVMNIKNAVDELRHYGIEVEDIRTDPYTSRRFTFFDPMVSRWNCMKSE